MQAQILEELEAKVPNGRGEIIQNVQIHHRGKLIGTVRKSASEKHKSSFIIPRDKDVEARLNQLASRNNLIIFLKWDQILRGDFATEHSILGEEGNPITINIEDLPLELVVSDDKLSFSEEDFGITADRVSNTGFGSITTFVVADNNTPIRHTKCSSGINWIETKDSMQIGYVTDNNGNQLFWLRNCIEDTIGLLPSVWINDNIIHTENEHIDSIRNACMVMCELLRIAGNSNLTLNTFIACPSE